MQSWRRQGVAWLALAGLAPAFAAAVAPGAPTAHGKADGPAPAQATPVSETVVVEGRVLYIDRDSDRNHPGAGLKVEIWDRDKNFPVTGQKLDETVTDASGFFRSKAISNVDPDGPTGQREGTQDIFLKLFTNNGTIRLYQYGTTIEYTWQSYDVDPRDGYVANVPNGVYGMQPLIIQENTPNVEALWTFVNLAEGWLYLKEQSGRDPGEITGFWSKGNTDGPRYDPAARALFYRTDNAGYGDVIVQQEAYALAHNMLGELPGGWAACLAGPVDGVTQPTSAACAFVQGFATFFPMAVYNDPMFDSPALRGDFDKPRAGTLGWSDGDTVAGRVAGAFWDLFEGDETEDGYDAFNATFADIFAVIQARKPETMADWWAGWKAMGKDGCRALGSLAQNTIDYNSRPQVGTIPEVVLNEDETATVNLRDYIADGECPDDQLVFRMVDGGDPKAGVVFMPTGVVSITPEANWFGQTQASFEVSDGPAVVPFPLRIRVVPINDCPKVKPPVSDPPTARYKDAIVLNLLPHGEDVEDQPQLLRWDAAVPPQNEADIKVDGRGTTTLAFSLLKDTIEQYSARVELIVKDRDGCETRQPIVLSWDSRPNEAPVIIWDRFTREYTAAMNQKITVDLTDMAGDDRDPPDQLEWFVDPQTVDHAQFGYALPDNKQILIFEPEVNYKGSDEVGISVKDLGGLSARAAITLTWLDPDVYNNVPPQILRNRLIGKLGGLNATTCYDLTDKADDPDDPISSLKWYATGYSLQDLSVRGEGTRQLCLSLSPQRYNFEGCFPTMFVVRDPKGGEDKHEVRTCWRKIALYMPWTVQKKATALARGR
ncbi:hypothetical protein DCC79_04935 [bacterium]|nr:hypothetical protein [Chloroflexi bacterium CFX6]RIL11428.1 MAG: hypothetical protein DCC79_04935 [bacterium]